MTVLLFVAVALAFVLVNFYTALGQVRRNYLIEQQMIDMLRDMRRRIEEARR